MQPASFEQLSTARPLYKTIEVQAWGKAIRIRRLTALERLDISDQFNGAERLETADAFRFGVRLLELSAVDADGQSMFATPEARQWLECESAAVLELMDALLEHNEMGATAAAAAKNA